MIPFQSSLEGKVGILTGGTSGFGFQMVKEIMSQGANLAVFSVDELNSDAAGELSVIDGGKAEYIQKNILDNKAADEMVEKAMSIYGKLDFVIANAGLAIRFEEPLVNLPTEKIVEAMRNQFEMFPISLATLAIRAAEVMAPVYREIKPDRNGHRPDSGAIVATLSIAALVSLRDDLLAYSAAKRAGLSVVESLAATLGPDNIRVNAIAPGFSNTAGPRKFYARHPEINQDIESGVHLSPSFLDPGAVVPAVMYLLTDNFITGQCITMDGGYTNNTRCYFQDR